MFQLSEKCSTTRRRVGCTQHGGHVPAKRTLRGPVENVGLKVHQQVVRYHATVCAKDMKLTRSTDDKRANLSPTMLFSSFVSDWCRFPAKQDMTNFYDGGVVEAHRRGCYNFCLSILPCPSSRIPTVGA